MNEMENDSFKQTQALSFKPIHVSTNQMSHKSFSKPGPLDSKDVLPPGFLDVEGMKWLTTR